MHTNRAHVPAAAGSCHCNLSTTENVHLAASCANISIFYIPLVSANTHFSFLLLYSPLIFTSPPLIYTSAPEYTVQRKCKSLR